MITPEKIDVVLRYFERVLPMAEKSGEGHLDMTMACVENSDHFCGTVHCAAGWYAVAKKGSEEWNNLSRFKREINYSDGAIWMARDLGFESFFDLKDWARLHPELWGNTMGKHMFVMNSAYGETSPAESLYDIYNHWTRVRGRLAAKGAK